jgi:hypothetical protein
MNNKTADFFEGREIRTLLANFLDNNFSSEELRDICFHLNPLYYKLFQWEIDYENLEGKTKKAKARELVRYVDRHGGDHSTFILLKEAIKKRSGRDWQNELNLKCPCTLLELVNLLQEFDDNQLINLFVNHGVDFGNETPVGKYKQEIRKSKVVGSILEIYKRDVVPGFIETLIKNHPELELVAALSLTEDQIVDLGLDKPITQSDYKDGQSSAEKLDTDVPPNSYQAVDVQESTATLRWLKGFGFIKEPFSDWSFNGEQDPLLEAHDGGAFVLPLEYNEVRGHPDAPGFRYIFGIAGSGKSALRRSLQSEFDRNFLYPSLAMSPKILAIEYLEHVDQRQKDVNSHIKVILQSILRKIKAMPGRFVSDTMKEIIQQLEELSDNAEPASLTRVMKLCRNGGIEGICILVDNIDAQFDEDVEVGFNRIRSLAARYDLLLTPGLMFKFFFPLRAI